MYSDSNRGERILRDLILISEHISIEGGGTLVSYLENSGHVMRTVSLDHKGTFPRNIDRIKALVILGGPMNVDQEEEYPYLADELGFIKKAIVGNVPVLGICLGAQLIAKALGASVRKNHKKEIGWSKIRFTPEAKEDLLFKDMTEPLDVFQWHEDTFDLPKGSVLLAGSKDCTHQAFRFKDSVYGFQFHIEVTKEMVIRWIEAYLGDEALKGSEGCRILSGFDNLRKDHKDITNKIFENIQNMIASSNNRRSFPPVV